MGNSLDQVNRDNQAWKDRHDVDLAWREWEKRRMQEKKSEWAAKAQRLGNDIHFYHSTARDIPRGQMPWAYTQCFCNLRLTSHDGLSNTVVEMALMGRHSLWNNPVPGATPWKDEYDIIRFVERERQRKHPDLELREEMLDYLNVGNEWMLI